MTFRAAGRFVPNDYGIAEGELADINPNAVPLICAMLVANRQRTDNKELANDQAGEHIMALLRPAANRIIDEIRQARGALLGQELVSTDPGVTATYPGVSMRELLYNDTDGLRGVNERLQLVLDSYDGENIEETIENIRLIALILGAI